MSEYKTKINQRKTDLVASLVEMFGEADDYLFADFRGLTVDQIADLRRRLRETNAEFRVIKNNFAKLAFAEMGKPDVSEYLVGPTAVALTRGDSGPVAKALFEFAKDTTVEVKGALIGDSVFTREQTEAYSKLPSKEALLASLLGTMNAPVQNLVYVLNGVTTKLVRTVQAVADAK
jgi:large subunit ribosomal protein L10